MRKAYIEGINGSIEVTNSFIVVKIGSKKVYSNKEILLSFEEIEDITYKKPTRDKYGHITLYTISNKKYTLLLDKVNNKYIEESKKIYSIINEIVANNKKVKVEENEVDEETVLEYQIPVKEDTKEEKIPLVEEETIESIKPTKEIQIEVKTPLDEDLNIPKKNTVEVGIKGNDIGENKPENTTSFTEEKKKDEQSNEVIIQEEPVIDDNVEEKEEYDDEEKKNLATIELLEQKLRELKKELERIYYKESIIVKYVDDTKDKDEIERLIAEIEELTKALEKIKKEIKSQEKNITDDTILLDNGNVVITNINRDFIGDDKEKINEYISTYKNTLDKIESIEKETETLSENADSKKDEINLSEEAYERDVNLLYDVEKTSDFIKKYIEDARTNLNNVKREVETSVDRLSRFRAVRRGISNQTRLLSAMLTINSLRRNRNRRINFALGVATGVSFIRDVFSYDFVEEYYNEITKKETLVGLENVDTNSARYLINDAKKQLDTLLEDCEKTYSDYPDFDDLKSQIIDLKNDIEKEDKELKEMEDKLQQYKGEERVKILKYKDE